MLTAEDRIFAPLALEVNVADLRHFEEEQRSIAKGRESEKMKLTLRLTKLE